jgi:DNA-binding transcriptional ArsR family regulator
MTREPLAEQVRRFKALGHPTRLRLAAMLAGGELCVCQMTAVLQLAFSTVSAHLAELRGAGLVRERKEGRWVFYALEEDGRRLLEEVAGALAADARVREDSNAAARLRALGPELLCRVGVNAGAASAEPARAGQRSEGREGRHVEEV